MTVMSSSPSSSSSSSSLSCIIDSSTNTSDGQEDTVVPELRRGPWTSEEDKLLIRAVSRHGEGRWNHLTELSGLRRTGKSCRLRWLNYLNPGVKRGNLTLQEQLRILELRCNWGNRWSKIARELPGRTDNEIKNYWRTRVEKQARNLNIDSNSEMFRGVIMNLWIPILIQRIEESSQTLIIPPNQLTPQGPFQNSDYLVSEEFNTSSGLCSSESVNLSQILPFYVQGDGYCQEENNMEEVFKVMRNSRMVESICGENDLTDSLLNVDDFMIQVGEGSAMDRFFNGRKT